MQLTKVCNEITKCTRVQVCCLDGGRACGKERKGGGKGREGSEFLGDCWIAKLKQST